MTRNRQSETKAYSLTKKENERCFILEVKVPGDMDFPGFYCSTMNSPDGDDLFFILDYLLKKAYAKENEEL